MTCRRAFEIDLADFLERPAAPEFAGFRTHYPRCADCAPEVRAWTELHFRLGNGGPAHPAPEVLLRFQDEPARLSVAERGGIERHLATCPPCRDELRALRGFDFSVLTRAPAPGRRWRFPSLALPRLGRVLLHPAFAYALVLALLYPALTSRVAHEPPPTAPAPVVDAPKERLAARVERLRSFADEQAALPEPAPPSVEHEQRAAPSATGNAGPSTGAAPPASSPPALRGLAGQARPARPDAFAKDEADELQLAPARHRPEWPEIALTPDRTIEIAPGGEGITLSLPVPAAGQAAGAWVVRIQDVAGRRELREQVPGGSRARVRVPRPWLQPGEYRAELWVPGAPGATGVFAFRVTE